MAHLHSNNNHIPDYSVRGSAGTGKEKLIDDLHPIERQVKSTKSDSNKDGTNGLGIRLITFSIYIIFLVLFFIAFYRYTAGMPLPTFTGFLQHMETIPNITLQPDLFGQIAGDWGIFDFLRTFVNTIITILSVGVYGCSCIIQVMIIVTWFIGWAFGIA